MTAKIVQSSVFKNEFDHFYQILIPSLNSCGNCGVLKCFYCSKFTVSCSLCRNERCKNCFQFKNATDFFYEHCSKEQWNYICNFLHDLFDASWISRWYFKDITRPITSSIKNSCFLISSNCVKNSVKKNCNKRTIYYMKGNRTYKFFINNNNI